MKNTLRTAAVAAIVAVSALAVPTMASASTIYPPSDACTVSPTTITPGGSVQFACEAGTFRADEPVTITVNGESGRDAAFGFVRFEISTGAYDTASGADGELAATTITFPDNASGVYNIAALSTGSAGGTSSVTVNTDDGGSITGTGGNSDMVGLWAGGGLLLLAGGAVAVVAAVRRSRHAD